MIFIPEELGLIINLSHTAKYHKTNCNHEDCNVSLYQLRQTAMILQQLIKAKGLSTHYFDEASFYIEEMPLT